MAGDLLDRCRQFVESHLLGHIHPSARDLADFVHSEMGRAADKSLQNTAPLVLYFADEMGRAEFLAMIIEAKPGMISRKWP